MIGITLKHLRYLNALATHRHFGRAAESCFISQPALSIQIKELEAMIGAPLVERNSRQIRMTGLGEDLVERAKKILIAVDELDDVVRASKGEFIGRLRLGIIPTVAPYILPDIVKALGARFPRLDIQPREVITQSLIDDLLSYRLDAAVVALPISDPTIREFALFDEEFVLVRHHSETDEPVPSPERLVEMRLLLLEEGHCFRDQALSFCNMPGGRARDVMEGSSLSTLVQMVGAGIGLTLIPEMAVPFETRSPDVSVSRFAGKGPSRTVGMVWRKSNPLAGQMLQIGAIVRGIGQRRRDEIAALC
ncbi:MAG: hydrogen peroxide-inducible genes activator [Pseudomonadota bacterium]